MSDEVRRPAAGPVLVRAWLTIATIDFLWAVVLTAAYGGSQARLWQGVASVPFGPAMLDGGPLTVLAGIGVHLGVAFTWSCVFLAGWLALPMLRRIVDHAWGVAVVSAIYGPAIWVLMSRIFVPLTSGRDAPPITPRWWIQLAGHAVFVGLPIVWTVARYAGRESPSRD